MVRGLHEMVNLNHYSNDPPVSSLGDDLDQYMVDWGFTLYRTAYGPSTDERWDNLVRKIREEVRSELEEAVLFDGGDQAMVDRFYAHFTLDARSDASLYQDATMGQVRQLYNDAIGGTPLLSEGWPNWKLFLLADEEILAEVAGKEFYLKCVEAEYVAADHIPKCRRMGFGQLYFGWMKLTSKCLLDLRCDLEVKELSRIAPPAIGGRYLEVWDGDRMRTRPYILDKSVVQDTTLLEAGLNGHHNV